MPFLLNMPSMFRDLLPISSARRINWLRRSLLSLTKDLRILRNNYPQDGHIHVHYGFNSIPTREDPDKIVHGGLVKVQRMQAAFPNYCHDFNILYLVSSALPNGECVKAWLSKRRGVRVVVNQNGVASPAWPDRGWRATNAPMSMLHKMADYVFYQSSFCKMSAERFLSARNGPSEILHNAVDTMMFTPAKVDPDPNHLILLLGGNQNQFYRIECALRTVKVLADAKVDAKLIVTGRLSWNPSEVLGRETADALVNQLGIKKRVEFLPPYSQAYAPDVIRKAHILLHPQYNDASPGLVVEAMACGLPVVYSKSGGVPEIVGEEAGIGVPSGLSWVSDIPPDAHALASAVIEVAKNRKQYAEAARRRAEQYFDLKPWLKRHSQVFKSLIR